MILSGRLSRWVRGCPPAWQITRAVSEDSGPLAGHIENCPSCAAEYGRLREIVVRAGVLAAGDDMSPETGQAISARLLGGGVTSAAIPWRFPGKPLWWGALGMTVLAISWGAWALSSRGRRPDSAMSEPVSASGSTDTDTDADTSAATSASPSTAKIASRSPASIRAVEAARFTRIAPPPDERILLEEGVIALDVVTLARGERFRVVTKDAEVEVRGTHFEVSASHGRLVAVRVTTGRVQVTSKGGALATLDAGDEWVSGGAGGARPAIVPRATPARSTQASVAMSPAASTGPDRQMPEPGSRPVREVVAPLRPRNDRPDEEGGRRPTVASSFDNAWSLLRKGDTRAAAAAFADVERAAVGSSLVEDASYWRAVAVARSGDSATAQRLFGEFLRRFPASARRGEASVALGWLLLEAGQWGDARIAFERAVSDPSAPVRTSAREGLGRVGRR